MTRSFQEINCPFSEDHQSKVATHKKSMPIIKCVCGFDILVLPDLKAMNIAINKHVADHKKATGSSERLIEFLTKQIMILASKMNPPKIN